MRVPGMGYNASSRTAKMFYGALLDQQVYWEATMAAEAVDGIVQFDLPVRRNNTTPCIINLSRICFSLLPSAPNYRSTIATCVCPAR